MRRPDYLKEGDKIGIAATARKVSEQEMQPCIYILESWGLEVVLSEELYAKDDQFAGSDQLRARGLQAMLDDESIKAILFDRGGYGSVRMVDLLDFTGLILNPKWLIGYSDITVLHSHVQIHCEIETIHGVMAINFAEDNQGVQGLRQTTFGDPPAFELEAHKLNVIGSSKGVIVGGNLSLLYSIIGSNSNLDTAGRILFIEDLDEYLYHMDRMMMNLKRTGMLSELNGLIVGGMRDMNDNEIPFGKTAEQIIANAVAEYNYPVCFNFPAGHIKGNMPLILGREASLEVNELGSTLSYG
ncbi:MAG: LD-carboxypeptidase [Flavobacteriales bacterium]|nr:LD-carboxypeptidase [Flavobacteriales bacterium]